jgi:signal transduction histidine kinase
MGEQLKKNYFMIVRIILMLSFGIGGYLKMDKATTGVSVLILLLIAFFIAAMSLLATNEKNPDYDNTRSDKSKNILGIASLLTGAGLFTAMMLVGGKSFILLGFYLIYEAFTFFKVPAFCFFLPLGLVFIDTPIGFLAQFLILSMMTGCYIQQEFVVSSYKKQIQEETILEQGLKRDMETREQATKAELKRNMLAASNQILEERSNLAQALHDKLGHNINGSIYQLEAIKLLMDKDPEKSKQMTQAVIDQLRTGMDEIRAILRKERPEKKDLALLQIYKLCEDCNQKGVETNLEIEGDVTQITDRLWEVILDNAFEAVSNSMKYARCKNILIKINILNKFVRCSITDDGVGCENIKDGMGISGMRSRVRSVNGTLDFASEAGFTVNMLLPI